MLKIADHCYFYRWVIKREKLAQAAKAGTGIAPEPLVGLKRKRPFETSQLSDLSDSQSVGSSGRRAQRKITQSTRSKRVHLDSDLDSDEPDTDIDAARFGSTQRKNPADSTPSRPKAARQPPVFKPSSGRPLPVPQWTVTAPPAEPSRTFKLPTSSLKLNTTHKANAKGQQKASAKVGPSQDGESTPYEPSYAEIESFEFKLVVSYSEDGTDYHQSTDLQDNMKSFWSRLKKQREEWEDAAGAEWAWELQKAKNRVRGRRSCVARKLAKKPTLWRNGDTGNYACRNCSKNTLLCFTWVEDEDPEHDGDEDEPIIPKPKGEFWCLPVHHEDRWGAEVKKDREIRTWLNEEDNSESDSSGEDVAESSEEDDFKVESSDYDKLSESESSTEEEDSAKESDDDDDEL